jgi:NAD(P)-dependent dehydrogenase (short-subunit alcohol dehydrogenase family)
MDRVKGKVALVTGAAGGLGTAFSVLMAREGAKVAVTDINVEGGKKTVAQIKKEGGEAFFQRQDVTVEKDWEDIMAKIMSEYGRLDILVNNAGILYEKAIEDTTLEQWNHMIATNLTSNFLGTKHAVKPMRKSGGGSIINISSVAAIIATVDDTSQYIAAKGGIRSFTKAAAIEFSKMVKDYHIRVNSVHPGAILTNMVKGMPPDMSQKLVNRAPMMRFADPMEVAYGVLFLASDEASFVTGSELVIDGGWIIV